MYRSLISWFVLSVDNYRTRMTLQSAVSLVHEEESY